MNKGKNPEHVWLYQGLNRLVNAEADAEREAMRRKPHTKLVRARTRDQRAEHAPSTDPDHAHVQWLARQLSSELGTGSLASLIHPELRLTLIHKLSAS